MSISRRAKEIIWYIYTEVENMSYVTLFESEQCGKE